MVCMKQGCKSTEFFFFFFFTINKDITILIYLFPISWNLKELVHWYRNTKEVK